MMWLEGVQLTSSPDRSRGQEVVAGRQMGLKLWAGKEERRRGMGGSWEDPGHSVGLSHLLPAASGDPEEATARSWILMFWASVLQPFFWRRTSGRRCGVRRVWSLSVSTGRHKGAQVSGQGPTERLRQD